jgi:hypothetical protein
MQRCTWHTERARDGSDSNDLRLAIVLARSAPKIGTPNIAREDSPKPMTSLLFAEVASTADARPNLLIAGRELYRLARSREGAH